MRLDLGCGPYKHKGFLGVDVLSFPGVDIVADLTKEFPFADSSVSEIIAYDFIEHLPDRIHTMNELFRICKNQAIIDIRVPSTDGRGAFQDPTHVSFWNANSFYYYCVDFPSYHKLCQSYGFKGAFKLLELNHTILTHAGGSDNVIHVAAKLLVIKPEAESDTTTHFTHQGVTNQQFFNLEEISRKMAQYQANQDHSELLNDLKNTRLSFAKQLLKTSVSEIDTSYHHQIQKIHQELQNSIFKSESLTQSEVDFLQGLDIHYDSFEKIQLNHLLILMLYYWGYEIPILPNMEALPDYFVKDYVKFLLTTPFYFKAQEEITKAHHTLKYFIDFLHDKINQEPEQKLWHSLCTVVIENLVLLSLGLSPDNLQEILVKRSRIIEFFLEKSGHQLDYDFKDIQSTRKKIRLGILANNFAASAETFASLPIYEHLSREFQVILYAFNETQEETEEYCKLSANSFKVLPGNLAEQVHFIRNDDLDILFIAQNISAIVNSTYLLSLHRLAKIQIASVTSATTTGGRHIDYYLSGQLTDSHQNAQQHYSEKLLLLEGTAHCFSHDMQSELTDLSITRSHLGIPSDTIVFVSQANLYKITPELVQTWAKIIKMVPNSILMLLPFSPHCSQSYPVHSFTQTLENIFVQEEVQAERLKILNPHPIPNRSEVLEYLKLADIYLESYPFTGSASIIDALEVSLPVVTRQGEFFRNSISAALLQEINMTDLVAKDEKSYIQIASDLGKNSGVRQRIRQEIQQKMLDKPSFINPQAYAEKVEIVFKQIVSNYLKQQLIKDLKLQEINLIVFPDWHQSEEILNEDLTQALKTVLLHPKSSQITLLVEAEMLSDEESELAISSIVMNLLIEEGLEINEEMEIIPLGKLSPLEWQELIILLEGRIPLEHENRNLSTLVNSLRTYTPEQQILEEYQDLVVMT